MQPWGSWKSCLEHRAEELILAWVRVLDSLLAVEAWGPVLLPSPLWMLVVPVAQHTAHVGLSRISGMSEILCYCGDVLGLEGASKKRS